MLVALLATLRAGAYYVPLDPAHPPERNQRVLEVAQPRLLIAEERDPGASPERLAGHARRPRTGLRPPSKRAVGCCLGASIRRAWPT